jgi:hypothetical protein
MLEFDPKTHIYRVDGVVKPSYSQVMNRVAVRKEDESHWQSVSGSEYMSDPVAADFGHQAHAVFANKLRDIPCTYDNALIPWVQGFAFFMSKHDLEVKLVEQPMYSSIYGFCGTPDLVCIYNGKYCVIDWKTSTANNWRWALQLAAYSQLVRELYKLRANAKILRMSVRIYENHYDPTEYTKSSDWYCFLSLLNTYKTFTKGN